MNYIVFDLEWNQSATGMEPEVARLPFEIVEIGAVKLDGQRRRLGEFHRLVRPKIYKQFHQYTGEMLSITMKELAQGMSLKRAAGEFLDWCGEKPYVFCTWGDQDLMELARNMAFYGMKPLSEGPIPFLDVQKLFSISQEGNHLKRSLSHGVTAMNISKNIPFHRALGDARYTAGILQKLPEEVLSYYSYDIYHPPKDRASEIHVEDAGYKKYISRLFASREEAFLDHEVNSCKCYLCNRNLRKKVKWFTTNGRNYYCLAYCETHGWVKAKIRLRKSEGRGVFVVKTTKMIEEAEADRIRESRREALGGRLPLSHLEEPLLADSQETKEKSHLPA